MIRREALIDHRHDSRRYLIRALVALAGVMVVLLLLFIRLYFLQVVNYDHYATASRSNRLRLEVMPPVRGAITDRHGELLAVNVPAFSLSLVPEEIGDLDKLLAELGQLIDITEADIARFQEQRDRGRPFDAIVLRSHLSEQERALLAVNGHRFNGMRLDADSVRSYPLGPCLRTWLVMWEEFLPKTCRKLMPIDTAEPGFMANQVSKMSMRKHFMERTVFGLWSGMRWVVNYENCSAACPRKVRQSS